MFDDLLGPRPKKTLKDILKRTEEIIKEQKDYLDKTVAENTKQKLENPKQRPRENRTIHSGRRIHI